MKRHLLALGLAGLLYSGCAQQQVVSGPFRIPSTINEKLREPYARIVDTINEGLFEYPNLEMLVITSSSGMALHIKLDKKQIRRMYFIDSEQRIFHSAGLTGQICEVDCPECTVMIPKSKKTVTARPLLGKIAEGTIEYYEDLYEEGLKSFCRENNAWFVTPYSYIR